MAIRSGRLRHRIEIRKQDMTQRDEYGAVVGHTVIQRPWCSIKNISDSENVGTATTNLHRVMFEIRYSKELENPTSDMFIVFKNSVYDIEGVDNPYELNEKLKITATRRRIGSANGVDSCPSPL